MEIQQLVARREPWPLALESRGDAGALELAHERSVAIGPEGVAVRKTVRRQLGPRDQ